MAVLERLGASWTLLAAVVVSTVGVYVAVIALTRIAGVRSLATMSSFDVAATVAVGSTVASTALGSTPLASGVLVLLLLYALQWCVARLRRRGALAGAVDNRPLLLMAGPHLIAPSLRQVGVSSSEVSAALRRAGVLRLQDVRAVVMETTGDLSVLTGEGPLDAQLLDGVRGREHVLCAR